MTSRPDTGGNSGSREPSPSGLGPSGFDPGRVAVAKCIEIVRRVRDDFLSPEYATHQPLASFNERFACELAAKEIENEFRMGMIEQCHLLGKPSPFDRDAGLKGIARRKHD
jgi:hypothetical protein